MAERQLGRQASAGSRRKRGTSVNVWPVARQLGPCYKPPGWSAGLDSHRRRINGRCGARASVQGGAQRTSAFYRRRRKPVGHPRRRIIRVYRVKCLSGALMAGEPASDNTQDGDAVKKSTQRNKTPFTPARETIKWRVKRASVWTGLVRPMSGLISSGWQ